MIACEPQVWCCSGTSPLSRRHDRSRLLASGQQYMNFTTHGFPLCGRGEMSLLWCCCHLKCKIHFLNLEVKTSTITSVCVWFGRERLLKQEESSTFSWSSWCAIDFLQKEETFPCFWCECSSVHNTMVDCEKTTLLYCLFPDFLASLGFMISLPTLWVSRDLYVSIRFLPTDFVIAIANEVRKA